MVLATRFGVSRIVSTSLKPTATVYFSPIATGHWVMVNIA
jgi:hypothetical protein